MLKITHNNNEESFLIILVIEACKHLSTLIRKRLLILKFKKKKKCFNNENANTFEILINYLNEKVIRKVYLAAIDLIKLKTLHHILCRMMTVS